MSGMKTRYLLRRTDTDQFFVDPGDNPDHCQWVKHPLAARQWVDIDACAAAARTSQWIWQIPAVPHAISLPV
jgi:hypothetical protein